MDLREHTTLAWIFFIVEWAIRLVSTVVVPFRRSPEAAKGWLLLIYFEPIFGGVAYLLLGRAAPPGWRRKQLRHLPRALAPILGRLRHHPNLIRPELPPELMHAVILAQNLGHMPILDGNAAEVLPGYDKSIDRLVADIDAAVHHVHLLYYIFADDETGNRVAAALERAARRKVPCRVLVDSLGSRPSLKTLMPRLKQAGVAVNEMLPLGILPLSLTRLLLLGYFRGKVARLDLRNHRKIAVIDGHIGYTGSQNIVNATFKPGIVYEEMVVRVTGPVVLELQYVFVADWYLETQEVLDSPDVFPDPQLEGNVPAQALPSGPVFPTQNNQRLIVALIHGARQRVVITTPYFIPDEALLQAMQTAVARGVEVQLIVSKKPDQLLVGLAQRSYYEDLLEAGVKIHLYRENFLHAKYMTVDDDVAVVGSSNMDIRSFVLNDEIMLLLYDTRTAARFREDQDRHMAGSDLLTLEEWVKRPLWRQCFENLARLLSPLL